MKSTRRQGPGNAEGGRCGPERRRGSISRLVALLAVAAPLASQAQEVQLSKEALVSLTPEWSGERLPDGRPKVPDDILERMRLVTLEEAWAVLRNSNFKQQYAGGWQLLDPEGVLVGRALTAVFMPGRPDVHRAIQAHGLENGRVGGQNTWPVEMLQAGDVYVADQFGLHVDGPTVGDNVGSAIYANSGNGIVYDGALRDIAGLKEIEGFTAFFRSYHPSHHLNDPGGDLNTTLVSINGPTRIGEATVMPGDVVLGRDGGVIFIPPHLAERVVQTSEIVRLRDMFGQQRIREGVYTSGQIDTRWSRQIEQDFSQWLEDHIDELPVPREQIEDLLEQRTF
jgi:regulator of RNase E activity RraA